MIVTNIVTTVVIVTTLFFSNTGGIADLDSGAVNRWPTSLPCEKDCRQTCLDRICVNRCGCKSNGSRDLFTSQKGTVPWKTRLAAVQNPADYEVGAGGDCMTAKINRDCLRGQSKA